MTTHNEQEHDEYYVDVEGYHDQGKEENDLKFSVLPEGHVILIAIGYAIVMGATVYMLSIGHPMAPFVMIFTSLPVIVMLIVFSVVYVSEKQLNFAKLTIDENSFRMNKLAQSIVKLNGQYKKDNEELRSIIIKLYRQDQLNVYANFTEENVGVKPANGTDEKTLSFNLKAFDGLDDGSESNSTSA